MKLRCPNCDTPIPANSINVQQAIAICPNCDEMFPFGDSLPTRKPKDERKVKAPRQFRVEESSDGVLIESRLLPDRPTIRAIAALAYIVMAVLAFELTLLITVFLAGFTGSAGMGMFLGFTALIVSLVYVAVAGLTAKRQVIVDQDKVQVRFRPLLRPTRTFNRDDLAAIVPQAVTSGVGNQRKRIFDLDVRLRDGSRHVFLNRISGDEAAFIAQELNQVLFVHDAPPLLEEVEIEDSPTDQAQLAPLSDDSASRYKTRNL